MALSSRSLITKTGISTTQVFDMGGINIPGGDFNIGSAIKLGNASGIVTATSFVGALTGNVTGNASGNAATATLATNAQGLTGTPNISCGTIAGSTGTFTGDVDIADKIVHTGDTNTAIRFPAADTISAETGGSERLRIANNGYVGIGTATPDSILNLFGTGSDAATRISIKDGGIANVVGRNGNLAFQADVDGTVNGSLINFAIDGSEKLRIDSSGQVLIGTTTAAVSAGRAIMLAAADGARIKLCDSDLGVTASDGFEIIASNAGTAYVWNRENMPLLFGTNNTERLQIRADGRTQIKSGDFEVIGGEGANAEIRLTADEGDDGADYWRFQSAASGNNLNIATYASGAWVDKVSIDTNGKIGIGVASPSSFDVDGDDVVISTSGHTGITINSGSAGSTSRGSIYFAEGTAGDADKTRGAIQYQHGDDFLRFITNTVERVRIPSSGGIELKTDGKGIQYPTTQTPTNANTNRVGISSEMRYYETGTFTPGLSSTVLNSLQNEAFTNASYARRVGRYVRVGSLVHVTIEIQMAGSVTYNSGSTSTAPVCIVGATPFYYAYANRWAVSGQPDYYPCSISYSSSGLTNDTLYATLRRDFNAQARIEITKPGTGGSRQYDSTNFGEVFPANSMVTVSCTYCIDTSNADY